MKTNIRCSEQDEGAMRSMKTRVIGIIGLSASLNKRLPNGDFGVRIIHASDNELSNNHVAPADRGIRITGRTARNNIERGNTYIKGGDQRPLLFDQCHDIYTYSCSVNRMSPATARDAAPPLGAHVGVKESSPPSRSSAGRQRQKGSVWTRLAPLLEGRGDVASFAVTVLAQGGTSMADWAANGKCHARLLAAAPWSTRPPSRQPCPLPPR